MSEGFSISGRAGTLRERKIATAWPKTESKRFTAIGQKRDAEVLVAVGHARIAEIGVHLHRNMQQIPSGTQSEPPREIP